MVFKKQNKKEYKNPQNVKIINSQTTSPTNYYIRTNLHNITVEKQKKLALNPFDDKRVYLNPIQKVPWDKHTQKSDCP